VSARALRQGRRAIGAQACEHGVHASPRIQASCRADRTVHMTIACQRRAGLPLVRAVVLLEGLPSACNSKIGALPASCAMRCCGMQHAKARAHPGKSLRQPPRASGGAAGPLPVPLAGRREVIVGPRGGGGGGRGGGGRAAALQRGGVQRELGLAAQPRALGGEPAVRLRSRTRRRCSDAEVQKLGLTCGHKLVVRIDKHSTWR
jgi:hypothetical protein